MPKTQQQAPFLTTAEVAALLGCHIRTVHRRVARGDFGTLIKAPGLRGAYLFDRDAVDALLPEDDRQGTAA